MVTVADYAIRTNADGETFVALILHGDLEMVRSQDTGRFYATIRRASITSTFDEETAKRMIGRMIPGAITKESCEPYDYTIPETGEVIQLAHRYEYAPEEPVVNAAEVVFHANGKLAA